MQQEEINTRGEDPFACEKENIMEKVEEATGKSLDYSNKNYK